MFKMRQGLTAVRSILDSFSQHRRFLSDTQPVYNMPFDKFVASNIVKGEPRYKQLIVDILPRRSFSVSIPGRNESKLMVVSGSYFESDRKGRAFLKKIESVFWETEDKKGSKHGEVLTTSDVELHSKLRRDKACTLDTSRSLRSLLNPGDKVVSVVETQGHGTYFGGSPISSFPKGMREQIFVDQLLPMADSVQDWEATERSIDKGPRLSGYGALILIRDEKGNYRQELVESRGFVNSTVHYGTDYDTKGEEHPLVCYTPGTALKQGVKFDSAVKVLPNGDFIHSFSTYSTGAANVLLHWMCNFILGDYLSGQTGVPKEKIEGKFHKRVIQQGLGERFHEFAGLLTGTPFFMATVTMLRDHEGNIKAVMVHNRTKSWPASEFLLTMSNVEENLDLSDITHGPYSVPEEIKRIKDKSHRTTLYSLHAPDTDVMGDLTVTKLVTVALRESTIAHEKGADGKFHPIDKDSAVFQEMLKANKELRFTFKELKDNDAAFGMLLSVMGASLNDIRPRIVEISETGDFSAEQREQMWEKLIHKNPESIEHYFCNNAAKIIVVRLNEYMSQNPNAWKQDKEFRDLWDFVTSKTPNYGALKAGRAKYESVIKRVFAEKPDLIKELNICFDWAKKSRMVATIQEDERYGSRGPMYD